MAGNEPRSSASRPGGDADQASAVSPRPVMVVAVVGLLLTAGVSAWLWSRATTQAESTLSQRGQLVVETVAAAMGNVVDHLKAVGGLYQASEEVTQAEFGRFVSNFGVAPGVSGIAHAQVVPVGELDEFESTMAPTIPGYRVFKFTDEGRPVPVGDRATYVPLEWLESNTQAFDPPFGFDMASETFLMEALEEARESQDAAATSFVQLPFEDDTDWFVVFWPITDTTGAVDGFTVALIDLSDFLEAQIPPALGESVEWAMTDLTSGQDASPLATGVSWSAELDVVGRTWDVTVKPSVAGDAAPDRTSFVLVLLAGVVASFLASYGLYEYRQKAETRQELNRLRELAAAKDQFLASVSHELRTPLTGVLGFAELLVHDADSLDDDEKRWMIENIAVDAGDLAAIIDDLLVAARSELDLVAVTSEPIDLESLIDSTLAVLGDEIPRHAMTGSSGTPEVMGDPARVRQILRNLVSNAHRYGGEQIRIDLGWSAEMGHIRVLDDGPALSAEDWERIFEPYVRLHQDAGKPASLGIGLSVSRHLARLMNGDITYRHHDGWSVFDLSLPTAPARASISEGVAEPLTVDEVASRRLLRR